MLDICDELMESGGFHLVEVHQWDKTRNEVITITDVSRADYTGLEGPRYSLLYYPLSLEVVQTGKFTAINIEMDCPETEWMEFYGLNSVIQLPIYCQDNIIGFSSLGMVDHAELLTDRCIRECQKLIDRMSNILVSPLNCNSKQVLFEMANDLRDIAGTTSCSLSAWLPESLDAVTVIDYSKTIWIPGNGTKQYLNEGMSASKVMETKVPAVVYSTDSGLHPEEAEDFENYQILTKIVLPLSIGSKIIGYIDLSDIERERAISEEELYKWGGIAGQAALAINNYEVMNMAQEIFDFQTHLRKSIEVISSSVDLNVIFTHVTEQVGQALRACQGIGAEYQDEFRQFKVAATYHDPKLADALTPDELKESLEFAQQVPRAKYSSQAPVSQFQFDDPNLSAKDRRFMQQFKIKTRLFIPIHLRHSLFGFIELWYLRAAHETTDMEIQLCQSISLQASIAIDNTSLYRQAQTEIKLRKQIEAQLRHEALHDPLTRLPNRRLFIDRLEQAISKQARAGDDQFSVLYFDLDKFKWINDTFGHQGGDSVLIQVADCLRSCLRDYDTAARFGGDEFLVLIERDNSEELVATICRRIQAELYKSIKIDGRAIPLSTSIGVAASSHELTTADEYINRADIAMYEAKSTGGSNLKIFAPDDITIPINNLDLRAEVRDAVNNQEFELHYQPLIRLDTLEVVGLEALLRWRRPNGETVSPDIFIPVIEDLRLMSVLGQWIMQSSITQFNEWQLLFEQFGTMTLSLNLSISQITDPDFLSQLETFVAQPNVEPERINFEITESLFIHNLPLVSSLLKELQKMGFGVHLDDFGTGYSSLSYLTELPFDTIKIDRSFIRKIDSQSESKDLLASILSLGRNLKKQVLAEGIENQQQLKILQGLGCPLGQGFLFSRALSVDEMENFITKKQHLVFETLPNAKLATN